MIPNPWWLRFMDGGNAKTSAIAAVAFAIGYMWGKGDKSRWQNVARGYDYHWQNHHKDNNQQDSHGKHTQREHEREHDRQHKRGEGYERER